MSGRSGRSRSGRGRAPGKGAGQVRIIAGAWRGRKLDVPDLPGLRPSGDRGRETLFNWLQPQLPGARCADLFAGSGALGFEAASRGAAHVDLVEIAPLAVSALVESRSALRAEQVAVHRANALDWLAGQAPGSLDIVFIDPPFDSGLAVQTLGKLQQGGAVAPGGLVYVETAAQLPELVMQPPFELAKEKVLGEVRMRLFRRA
ncbi:MAG: 16S rRNA (guanine(966)-N(2))-methyltransferase RsmD [Xanthomonadales bacterium]|nr:16S rRNA (guanine(966)-N(2))-methyltransferase RsmD [Xanthomonadales bacterium]